VGSFFVLPLGLVVTHLSENLLIKKSIPQIMSLLPIIQQTNVNLVKGQIRARKNLQKIIAAGEGRAKKILRRCSTAGR
jgi:energy-converting hydrogenase Eha subunit H